MLEYLVVHHLIYEEDTQWSDLLVVGPLREEGGGE